MKRIGNIFPLIYCMDNLRLADAIAQKGKAKQKGVIRHKANAEENIAAIHEMLKEGTFKTSDYTTFQIREPKERTVFSLPYYPDRIVQHAIMNVLEPTFVAAFTADTYSCIKGKGVHGAVRAVKRALKDIAGTQYCLKFDITKFYPSVNHDILKALLRRKFKDADLLALLDEIIDSAPGLPIGNYLSQFFANFFLSYFDHWIKETKRVKYYFRYADDIVILCRDKAELHGLLSDIRIYFQTRLDLQIKGNYQVFPVAARGIDFLGYKFFHTHTLLRKSIKQSFAREVAGKNRLQSIASHLGWAKHADTRHLVKTILKTDTMTYTLTITGETPNELAALLAGLNTGSAAPAPLKQAPKAVKPELTETAVDAPVVVPPVDGEKVTTEAVRLAVSTKTKNEPGKREAIKALLTKHGAASVAVLTEDKYAAFLEELKNL